MTFAIRTAAALSIALAATSAQAGDPLTTEVILPEDVLVRVADLWEQGDRYEAAIDQIIATSALPEWSGGCDCDAAETPDAELPVGM